VSIKYFEITNSGKINFAMVNVIEKNAVKKNINPEKCLFDFEFSNSGKKVLVFFRP
jgi:hypothetical protein